MKLFFPLFLIIAIVFFAFISGSEELTTENLVPDMSQFSTSGSTSYGTGHGCQTGKYCTSGTRGGGGTYSSNFNVPLSEGEVRQGFTLNSGITINSHSSNSYLQTCQNIMQSGDCRDIFKLTINLLDGQNIVETFTHQEELTWSGLKEFKFTDQVSENEYGILTGNFSLYGIDAGYPSGFYGPQFSNPTLNIDYTTVLIQQHIETEIQNTIAETANIIAIASVEIPSINTTVITPAPTSTNTTVNQQPETSNVEPAQTNSSQEPRAEANVEASVENRIQTNANQQSNKQPKKITVQQAAQAVVAKIAPSQRYSSSNQTVTMVAMRMMSNTSELIQSTGIPDAVKFFKSTKIPDGPNMIDIANNYSFIGQSNGRHDSLVESQWSK